MPHESSTTIKVRIKDALLAEIDAAAEKAGMNRSQYVIFKLGAKAAKQVVDAISDRSGDFFYRETAKDILSGAKPPTAPGPYARPAHHPTCHCAMCRA